PFPPEAGLGFPSPPGSDLGSTLSVTGTEPADGSTLNAGPTAITAVFDRPLDPFSLTSNDLYLVQVGDDGGLTPLYQSSDQVQEPLDETGTRLTVTLPIALGAGHYRIMLPGFSGLAGQDFSMIAGDGNDQVLGEFTVEKAGITRDQAVPLDLHAGSGSAS